MLDNNAIEFLTRSFGFVLLTIIITSWMLSLVILFVGAIIVNAINNNNKKKEETN